MFLAKEETEDSDRKAQSFSLNKSVMDILNFLKSS